MEQTSVPLICAGFCDDTQVSAKCAVFRRNNTLDDLHLANSFGAHNVNLRKTTIAAEVDRARITVCVRTVGACTHRSATKTIHTKPHTATSRGYGFAFTETGTGIFDDRSDIPIDHGQALNL